MAAGAGAAAQVRDTEPSPAEAFRSVIGPGQMDPGGVLGEADADGGTVLKVGSDTDGVGVAEAVGAGEVGVAVSEGTGAVCSLEVDVDWAELLEFSVAELVDVGAGVRVAVGVAVGVGVGVTVGVGVGVAVGTGVGTTGTTGSTHAGGMARAASPPWAAPAAQGDAAAMTQTPSGIAIPARNRRKRIFLIMVPSRDHATDLAECVLTSPGIPRFQQLPGNLPGTPPDRPHLNRKPCRSAHG